MTGYVCAGIDLAIAKGKRLPIVVCRREGGRVVPLALRGRTLPEPPKGCGNAAIIDPSVRRQFAEDAVAYLETVERRFGVEIGRVAIDAPSAPRANGLPLRAAEAALRREGISFIQTPNEATFDQMPARVREHLATGGSEATLPCANQLWMLFGFELFAAAGRRGWPCLEVYPQATVHVLGVGHTHKTKAGAVVAQLSAAAKYTGWPDDPSLRALQEVGYGSAHDRLDAYLATWVACLEPSERRAMGHPPHDAIWVPRVAG